MEVERMLDAARELSKGEGVVLLLSPGIDTDRLLPAYLNALVRSREECMRASSLQVETLLFVSGTMRISEAIRACGAKSGNDFLAFASDEAIMKRFLANAEARVKRRLALRLDPDSAGSISMAGVSDR